MKQKMFGSPERNTQIRDNMKTKTNKGKQTLHRILTSFLIQFRLDIVRLSNVCVRWHRHLSSNSFIEKNHCNYILILTFSYSDRNLSFTFKEICSDFATNQKPQYVDPSVVLFPRLDPRNLRMCFDDQYRIFLIVDTIKTCQVCHFEKERIVDLLK